MLDKYDLLEAEAEAEGSTESIGADAYHHRDVTRLAFASAISLRKSLKGRCLGLLVLSLHLGRIHLPE